MSDLASVHRVGGYASIPPPWIVQEEPDDPYRYVVTTADGTRVACMSTGTPGVQHATGTLIAAAPDLLAACEAAYAWLQAPEDSSGHEVDLHRLTGMFADAITKATGGENGN